MAFVIFVTCRVAVASQAPEVVKASWEKLSPVLPPVAWLVMVRLPAANADADGAVSVATVSRPAAMSTTDEADTLRLRVERMMRCFPSEGAISLEGCCTRPTGRGLCLSLIHI